MHSLVHSEIFDLALVIGTYIAATILYKKTHLSVLHPLLTSIFVIIVILEFLDIEYASFQQGSHLIHFMLGPSVVALGYVLFEQMKYLKGNVVSILTSVFVIISVIVIGKLMGADQSLIATLQPKSVTTPIAMGISEKNGGIPSLTAVIVVAVGIFGSIVGPAVMKVLGIESRIAKGESIRYRKPYSQRTGPGRFVARSRYGSSHPAGSRRRRIKRTRFVTRSRYGSSHPAGSRRRRIKRTGHRSDGYYDRHSGTGHFVSAFVVRII